jgi:hypothetical protein
MNGARCTPALLAAALLTSLCPVAQGEQPAAIEGRFLFAGDDDWDWASPLGADKPCKLVRYGRMPWSALDWAEQGLEEVRGAIVGIPPDPKKTLSLEELSKLRGPKAKYRHHPQNPGVIRNMLKGENAPNVIILMQNTGNKGTLRAECLERLEQFVRNGGRVVVLDEWRKYGAVLDTMVATARTLPAGPAIPPTPVVKRPPVPPKEPEQAPKEKEKNPSEPRATFPAGEIKARLKELIPGLSDESFRIREESTKAILALGTEVLPHLARIESDDPEVAVRLRRIQSKLKPKASLQKKPVAGAKQRALQRATKRKRSAEQVQTAAKKLREKNVSFQLSDVLVDGDKQILPVLRISFPAAQ